MTVANLCTYPGETWQTDRANVAADKCVVRSYTRSVPYSLYSNQCRPASERPEKIVGLFRSILRRVFPIFFGHLRY